MSQRPDHPSPYHASAMGITLLEYYRRLLICIVNDSGNSGLVKGEDLLNVSASDGLLLKFDKAGVILRTEPAEAGWEAHIGTPGSKEPASWTVPSRPQIEQANKSLRDIVPTDEQLATLEAKRNLEAAQHAIETGEAGVRGGRVPFYTADKPRSRKEPTQ